MKLNPFGKSKPQKKEKTQAPVVQAALPSESETNFAGTRNVLKHFYVSEKSTFLGAFNQYVFAVDAEANKREIAKQVAQQYKVKVKDVKVLNMPAKRRDIGRYPGFRPGYRKAIVVLEKGNVIEQARP